MAETKEIVNLVFVCKGIKTIVTGQGEGLQTAGVEEFQMSLIVTVPVLPSVMSLLNMAEKTGLRDAPVVKPTNAYN